MTPELWQRLKPLFHAALERGADDRARFIAEVCGDDAELKENLVQLINAAQDETKTFDSPMVRRFPSQTARFQSGEVILGRVIKLVICAGLFEK
jgi:hypothetical protein